MSLLRRGTKPDTGPRQVRALDRRQRRERRRHEAALLRQRGQMQRGDLQFLPAALEILETPPSPVRLRLMMLIVGLAVTAVGWAYIGRVDVVAIAQGKIQAIGRTKIIQPLESGRVTTLYVDNGRQVRAGDVLVELDPSVSRADETTLSSGLHAFEAEVKRRHAAIDAAGRRNPGPSLIRWGDDVPAAVAEREQRILENDLGQLAAAVAASTAAMQDKAADHDRLVATVAAEERLVSVLKARVTMRSTLLDRAAGSHASVIDAQEALETQQTYLANLRGQAAETAAAVQVAARETDKIYRSFLADNSQKLADAERQAEEAGEKLAKARLITSRTVLRSPVDGVVQGLTITTIGQVVQGGEQIMEIVPEQGGLEIESYLPNQDIGFVRKGEAAIVKIEAFPFTRFGTIDAVVHRVALDAIPAPEAQQREETPGRTTNPAAFGGAQRTQNLVFPITLKLARSSIDVDGQAVRLSPGMAVTVEIKTGSRRILEYLFSPVAEVASGALRER